MTPRELIEAFETLADAPDGVKRLRELVLRLAVRGKLVRQDPADEAADRSLNAARIVLSERAEGVRRGLWKRTVEVTSDEAPFALPLGWAWARINDTGFYINGLPFKPCDWMSSGTPIVRIQNLSDPSKPFNYAQGDFHDDVLVQPGDLLVSWSATLEAFVWQGPQGVLNQHIFRVQPCDAAVGKPFLYYLLRQAIRDMAESDHAHGLVMPHINRGPFLAHVVAIPPLAEQHRIVARVDELLGLLDRLEAARAVRDEVRRVARDAALAALRDAEDTEALRLAWTRISDQMNALFATPEDMVPLRQAILQLAVRGRLVPHADAHIAVKVRDVVQWLNGHGFKSEWYTSVGIRLVRNQNISHGELDWSDSKFIPADRADEFRRFQLHAGDIVLSLDRPLISTGLKVAFVREADLPCLLLQRVACPRPKDEKIDPRYFYLWLNSPEFTGAINPGRSNGVPHIFTKTVDDMILRLPSMAEQHCIVATVDSLMALCDEFSARLTATRELQAQFAAATLHHLDV